MYMYMKGSHGNLRDEKLLLSAYFLNVYVEQKAEKRKDFLIKIFSFI